MTEEAATQVAVEATAMGLVAVEKAVSLEEAMEAPVGKAGRAEAGVLAAAREVEQERPGNNRARR